MRRAAPARCTCVTPGATKSPQARAWSLGTLRGLLIPCAGSSISCPASWTPGNATETDRACQTIRTMTQENPVKQRWTVDELVVFVDWIPSKHPGYGFVKDKRPVCNAPG